MNDQRVLAGNERAVLQEALALGGYRRLRMPAALEAAYKAHRQALSITQIHLHWRAVMLAIAMLVASLFVSGLVSAALQDLVVFGSVVVLLVIGMVVLGARVPLLHPSIDLLVALAAFIGLFGMHVGALVAPVDSDLRAIAEYGVIFITLALFTISGLSFAQSIAVCAATLLLTLLASFLSPAIAPWLAAADLPPMFTPVITPFAPDWGHFAFYGLGGVLIAALIGLSQEMRERKVFLQARLLTLEKRELDELSRELTLISREDALTHLANRRHFDEVFAREWSACLREGTLMNLIFIDVDFFKRYNDHYGHQAGDECLARVAAVLATQAKRGADFVARYGGEEFVAFFPRTNSDGLVAIAQRMIDAVDELQIAHACSEAAAHVTISVGLAVMNPAPGSSADALLHAADAALYRAKQAGRHRCAVSWQT